MLSVIILCGGASPQVLVRTLAPLVEAAVRGLVRDVVLAGAADGERMLIADHAGCTFVGACFEAEALAKAPAAARGRDLMILRAGYVPEPGFLEEVEDIFDNGEPIGEARCYLLRAAPEGFFERLFPALAPVVGMVAARELLATRLPSLSAFSAMMRRRKSLRRRLRRID